MHAWNLGLELGTKAANDPNEDWSLGWLGFDDPAIDRLESAGIAYGSFRWMLADWAAKRAFNRAVRAIRAR